MKPHALVCALAFAGCATAPPAERAIEIRTVVYEMPSELARSLTGREAWGGAPAPLELLERLRTAAAGRTDVEAKSRPMIRVREGSTAEISGMCETDCVQDYTLDAQGAKQALHAKAQDGLELELRPRAREARIELGYRAKQCRLVQPIAEIELTLSNGEKVKVQRPLVAVQETESKTTLKDGECFVLLYPGSSAERTTLVCVTAVPVAARP